MKRFVCNGENTSLFHKKQENPWGCMYHVLYAITGDESLLEFVDDLSVEGMYKRAVERGNLPWTLYTTIARRKAGMEFWGDMLARWPKTSILLDLSIDSIQYKEFGIRHAVGVLFNLRGEAGVNFPFAVVSDSGVDDFRSYDSLEEFVDSPYGQPYIVTTYYGVTKPYQPEMIWTLDAPHLKGYDWDAHKKKEDE